MWQPPTSATHLLGRQLLPQRLLLNLGALKPRPQASQLLCGQLLPSCRCRALAPDLMRQRIGFATQPCQLLLRAGRAAWRGKQVVGCCTQGRAAAVHL